MIDLQKDRRALTNLQNGYSNCFVVVQIKGVESLGAFFVLSVLVTNVLQFKCLGYLRPHVVQFLKVLQEAHHVNEFLVIRSARETGDRHSVVKLEHE